MKNKQRDAKPAPTPEAKRQTKRRRQQDAAAQRDGVLKDGKPANGSAAITEWMAGRYIMVKKESEAENE